MNKEGWDIKKLGEVCLIQRGGSPRPINQFITEDDNGINWIKIGDTESNSRYISSTKEKIKPEGLSKSRYVEKGDFLLSNSMSFGRPYILKINGCIHDGWLVIRDEQNIFNKDYLYFFLSSPKTYLKFKSLAVGGVVNNLNSEMVRNLDILIPPPSIQEQIVAELDTLSDIISKKHQQIAELDTLAQATFYELFGDPVDEPKFNKRKFKDISSVRQGLQIPISQRFTESGVNRYPYITNQFINGKKIAEYIENPRPNVICKKENVLMTRTGNTGIVISDIEGVFHNNFFLIDYDKEIICKKYLISFLKFPEIKELILKKASTTTIPDLNHSDFYSIEIPIPPLTLQNQFAEQIEAIEKQKELINQSITEVQKLFDYTMDKYFN